MACMKCDGPWSEWERTNKIRMVRSSFSFFERLFRNYPKWEIEQEWVREDNGDGYTNSMWRVVPYWEE